MNKTNNYWNDDIRDADGDHVDIEDIQLLTEYTSHQEERRTKQSKHSQFPIINKRIS